MCGVPTAHTLDNRESDAIEHDQALQPRYPGGVVGVGRGGGCVRVDLLADPAQGEVASCAAISYVLKMEVFNALSHVDTGLGFEAGLSIVFIAVVMDRITQA